MAPILRIQRLSPLAQIPAYQSDGAAGLDLHAAIDSARPIEPGAIEMIPIGIAIALPHGHEGQVRPRSGLASRHGITLPNAPGTIDEDYRGEVSVPLINLGTEPFTIEPGMRIAQMVIAPVTHCDIAEVAELERTERGHGGFGSTGVHSESN
ncbi:MAG: dUTP diphosphatase [Phycisphaerales bacterium]|jgi:dUTP pyrophosphatase|nr:dUTP diphosphatase [Phycisphaerales bacterium]